MLAPDAKGGLSAETCGESGVVPEQPHRGGERLRIARRHEQPGLAVGDDLGMPPMSLPITGFPAAAASMAAYGATSFQVLGSSDIDEPARKWPRLS